MKITPTTFPFILLLIISSYSAVSQGYFMDGYYIKTDGTKVNCLIANEDWRSNPEAISTKNNLNSEVKVIEMNEFKEFAINGVSKYIKKKISLLHEDLQYDYGVILEQLNH